MGAEPSKVFIFMTVHSGYDFPVRCHMSSMSPALQWPQVYSTFTFLPLGHPGPDCSKMRRE